MKKLPDDPTDLVWAVKIGEKTIQVRDLPLRVLDEIARDCEASAAYICALPQYDLRVAERLLAAAAAQLGVDGPDPEKLTGRDILGSKYFVQEKNDLPEEYEDGVPR